MTVAYQTPSAHKVPQRVIDGVWDRIDTRGSEECWPWKLSRGSHGYGQVGWQIGAGRNAGTTAHRVAYMAHHGLRGIAVGLVVDHICHNRVCCNPAHLRLLSNRANARDNGACPGKPRALPPMRHRQKALLAAMLADHPAVRFTDCPFSVWPRFEHRSVAASLVERGFVNEVAEHTYQLTDDGVAAATSINLTTEAAA